MLVKYILLCAVVMIFVSSPIKADDLDVDFSGFATLTMSYSDDPDIGFSSNYLNASEAGFSFRRDSLLGGQANITINNNWDAVVQAIYQDRSVKSFDNFLELAFIRYRPQRNWIFRAGRINSDLYLISEYNHVGYAYLWARPPHAYYSFASTAGHYDGVDVEYNNQINNGFLRIKFSVGQTTPKLIAGNETLAVTFDDLYTASAVYIKSAWTFRASASRTDISNFKSAPFDYLIDGLNSVASTGVWSQAAEFAHGFEYQHHKINYSSLGVAYDDTHWLIQAELGSATSDWTVIPSNTSAYLSVGYRVNEMTYFGGVSTAQNKKNTPKIVIPESLSYLPEAQSQAIYTLIANTDLAIKRSSADQESVNLGAKWYYSDKLVFKIQADHFIIKSSGAGLWDLKDLSQVDLEHNVNLVSFSANMVF